MRNTIVILSHVSQKSTVGYGVRNRRSGYFVFRNYTVSKWYFWHSWMEDDLTINSRTQENLFHLRTIVPWDKLAAQSLDATYSGLNWKSKERNRRKRNTRTRRVTHSFEAFILPHTLKSIRCIQINQVEGKSSSSFDFIGNSSHFSDSWQPYFLLFKWFWFCNANSRIQRASIESWSTQASSSDQCKEFSIQNIFFSYK